MIRRLFFAFHGLAIAGLVMAVGLKSDPAIEERFFPIRGPSTVTDVMRSPARLCWTWTGRKLRDAPSGDFDVFLDRPNGDRSYPEVFHEDTGVPWRKVVKAPIGETKSWRYCILLPPDVLPTDTLTLRQIIHYQGFLGLWDVPVPLPDVVSEGALVPHPSW